MKEREAWIEKEVRDFLQAADFLILRFRCTDKRLRENDAHLITSYCARISSLVAQLRNRDITETSRDVLSSSPSQKDDPRSKS